MGGKHLKRQRGRVGQVSKDTEVGNASGMNKERQHRMEHG